MRRQLKRILWAEWLVIVYSAISVSVLYAGGVVEVVQSVPLETTLEVPGIRQTQQVWLEMIRSAKKTIDLEQFYISTEPDNSMEPVLAEIRAAAARDVKVRFLLDSKFYANYPNEPKKLAKIPNIDVRIIDFSQHKGVQHSKYFIVDRNLVFLGSANFDCLALSHIHEVGIRTDDQDVSTKMEAIFSKDWESGKRIADIQPSSVESDQPARTVFEGTTLDSFHTSDPLADPQLVASPSDLNPAGVPHSLTEITRLLASAKKAVQIQVYQYTTKMFQGSGQWNILDLALRDAAERGVKIQLLVDAVSLKSGRVDLKSLASTKNIEVKTVTIPPWSGGVIPYARLIHSKYLLVDQTSAWVGTENWQDTYFTSSRNVGVILNTAQAVADLAKIFNRVWTSSYASKI